MDDSLNSDYSCSFKTAHHFRMLNFKSYRQATVADGSGGFLYLPVTDLFHLLKHTDGFCALGQSQGCHLYRRNLGEFRGQNTQLQRQTSSA